MANLSSLSPITTAATALSNLILVSPQSTIGYQPQNAPSGNGTAKAQPKPILFHYEGEQDVTIVSDITDHYIEDNTAIQDQIALKPEEVTTHGFIGELNDVPPKFLQLAGAIASRLTVIGAYAPALTETALIAYSEAFLLYQVAQNAIDSAVSTWSTINGSGGQSVINGNGLTEFPNQTKQQVVFQQFYGYWRSRTLFTVQTPWAVFQNMAIKSMRAIQDPETRVITDFQITFKLIRTASTETLQNAGPVRLDRNYTQAAGVTNLGTSTPISSISQTEGLTSMGVA